jgi:hypothetical protein
MPTQYSITVTNNSATSESFAVFQAVPSLANANALSLARFADSCEPGASLSFNLDAPSEPDVINAVTTQPECWVAAGKFEQGQVLDETQMPNAVQVVFPPDVYAVEVTLNPDKTWTVG